MLAGATTWSNEGDGLGGNPLPMLTGKSRVRGWSAGTQVCRYWSSQLAHHRQLHQFCSKGSLIGQQTRTLVEVHP